MKTGYALWAVTFVLLAQNLSLADRQLDQSEILQIFETLTSQPRNTWIPAGTIKATHLAYETSTGYATSSAAIVRYDGGRFYWEINVDSHTKQAEPTARSWRDDFDLSWNAKRVFAWDGERYTMYFRSGNHAIVTENTADIPVAVNGPLTAGLIPWGYGVYTYASLSTAESSAQVDGQGRLRLTMLVSNAGLKLEMVFVLDPAKDYAVLSCLQNNGGMSSTVKTYGDYKLVSDRWVPSTVTIDRYDDSEQTPKLLSHDEWDLTSISLNLPPEPFRVAYDTDALVEYYCPISDRPFRYRYCDEADTDRLLYQKLVIASTRDTQTRNCATVAMKYLAAELGKDVNDQQLAGLVTSPEEGTSLYELRQFARGLGLHCLAVKTDIRTLRNLTGSAAILHLPGLNHYVVLDHIDDEYVWIIDLDENKFYYRAKLDEFGLDWSEGTALLVSRDPIDLAPSSNVIGDGELHGVIGGFPNYFCTDLIQEGKIIPCSPMMFGVCASVYRVFWPRYGCQEDDEGGICEGIAMPGYTEADCEEDIYSPGSCSQLGASRTRSIRACY